MLLLFYTSSAKSILCLKVIKSLITIWAYYHFIFYGTGFANALLIQVFVIIKFPVAFAALYFVSMFSLLFCSLYNSLRISLLKNQILNDHIWSPTASADMRILVSQIYTILCLATSLLTFPLIYFTLFSLFFSFLFHIFNPIHDFLLKKRQRNCLFFDLILLNIKITFSILSDCILTIASILF